MAHAKDLKHLELLLPREVTCNQVLGDLTWPKLRSLRVDQFTTTPNELEDLLDRDTSLHILRLREGTLAKGTWQQWLSQVAGKWKTVKDVRLQGDFAAEEA